MTGRYYRVIFALAVLAVGAAVCVVTLLLPAGSEKDHSPAVEESSEPAAAAATKPFRWWEHVEQPTLAGPIDRPFEVEEAYVDGNGRIINPGDCDGDALPDEWEMKRYGTLRYDRSNYAGAPRIDLPAERDTNSDSDDDGLSDKWEREYFGHLKMGPMDDPDRDGFPNWVEQQKASQGHASKADEGLVDPLKPYLMDLSHKPRVLRRHAGERVGEFSTGTIEFWKKQEALHRKSGCADDGEKSSAGTSFDGPEDQ